MIPRSIFFILLLSLCGCKTDTLQKKDPVDYVNNNIGNISLMLMPTYPTTHLPNSMLRMIPSHADFVTDRMKGLPMNIPMHRQGDVLRIMPYCGDISTFDHEYEYRYDQERSTPYNYSVWLDDFDVAVEFAPSSKSGIYSFTFENNDSRFIVLRTVNNGEIRIEGKTMRGYENYRGVKHFFYLEFDRTPAQTGDLNKEKHAVSFAGFDVNTEKVTLRYGISYISEEQAKINLEKEIPAFDLNKIGQQARDIWNNTLGKIEVEGGSEDQKTTFYTALYRAHERMINISEDGKYYSGYDKKVHDDEGVPFWTDDWVWDTFLALHPLQTILAPTKQEQILASYIRMYEQSEEKWMPTFPCVFGDAHCMNGNHAAGVFLDAMNKNLKFDVEKAFEGMKRTVLTETMIP